MSVFANENNPNRLKSFKNKGKDEGVSMFNSIYGKCFSESQLRLLNEFLCS